MDVQTRINVTDLQRLRELTLDQIPLALAYEVNERLLATGEQEPVLAAKFGSAI